MPDPEEILQGGQSAESVIRIGDIVYRTTKAERSELPPHFLQYLEEKNFPHSPRFLGYDERGREMLSYLDGEVPRGIQLTKEQLCAAMKLLRNMHDLAAQSHLCNGHETICHHDFAPWNIIFKDEQLVGIIDFDEVAPGARVDDLAYAIWTFLDIGVAAISDTEQIERLLYLVNCYDLNNRKDFIPAVFQQQNRILQFRKDVVATSPDQQMREFSKGAIQRINKAIHWVKRNEQAIRTRL